MKFTDGLWAVKEGYTLDYPKEISDISTSESGITLFAPYTPQETAKDSIGCGLLTVQISAIGADTSCEAFALADGVFFNQTSPFFKPSFCSGSEQIHDSPVEKRTSFKYKFCTSSLLIAFTFIKTVG